jgi:hypothetical protein
MQQTADDLFQVAATGMGQVQKLGDFAKRKRMTSPREARKHLTFAQAS